MNYPTRFHSQEIRHGKNKDVSSGHLPAQTLFRPMDLINFH